ncbi:MAG: hypothetical protein COS40_10205 [Deltaproteobacteria bacterium CG03_land_8_20_14_0_80_45_14]|nr:MAG: hypothetical protein COS40_10205 [Deltaproteobacteria bacterium CG03_land_8_20_14_0_80_45_14]
MTRDLKFSRHIKSIWKVIRLFYLIFGLVVWIIANCSSANQTDTNSSSPDDVVKRFCKLDSEGKRLSSRTWGSFLPLVTWAEEITAGESIKVIHIIENFNIENTLVHDSIASVFVRYNYLGVTDTVEFSKPLKQEQVIEFRLLKQNRIWKIKEPVIAPHVNWESAIEYLKPAIDERPERKKQLELIIEKIKKAQRKWRAP